MTTQNQTLNVNYTPPRAMAAWPVVDVPNSKAKVIGYPLAPLAGVPLDASFQLNRTLTANRPESMLLTVTTNPILITGPATQTGFGAYRQCPTLGLGRNLVTNGGFVTQSHGWTLHANASVVVDSTSVTGYALRLVSTGTFQLSNQLFPIEAGKAYSVAMQLRDDNAASTEVFIDWVDASGNTLNQVVCFGAGPAGLAWSERTSLNNVAPGNARSMRINFTTGNSTAGITFLTAMRIAQQTTAPAAWVAGHQQYIQRSLAIYGAGTNLAADGDMEAVGVASYTATTATLTKDTTNPFAGGKRLKVVNTAANGKAAQTGALAAGQAITASVRVIGADAGAGLTLVSTPSGATIGGTQLGASADWVTRTASGVIAGGDTGWRVDLIGGSGTTVTSYFDNLWVANQAYDTGNADPSGQTHALAARVVSTNQFYLPSGFDVTSWSAVGVVRFDHAYTSHGTVDRYIFEIYVDATNRFPVWLNSTGGALTISKVRAGVVSAVTDGSATAFAAGDTISWGAKYTAAAGLVLFISKNGGAVNSYSVGTQEALLPISGAPTLYLGRYGGSSGFETDGTHTMVRVLKSGLSDAAVSAFVANPYQDPTDNDLAVWSFEGVTCLLPVWNDRILKLGTSYDWSTDVLSVGPNVSTAFGFRTTATVAAALDAWWIRSLEDATKDLKLPVVDKFDYKVPSRTFIGDPLQGGPKIVISSLQTYGEEFSLKLLFTSLADQTAKEAAIRLLAATSNTLYLQDQFGNLRKIAFTTDLVFSKHEPFLDATIAFIEAL